MHPGSTLQDDKIEAGGAEGEGKKSKKDLKKEAKKQEKAAKASAISYKFHFS